MVPRAAMVVTKNRAGVVLLGGLVMLNMTACRPPGPRDLLGGQALLAAGQTEAAIAKLETAVQLMPTNAVAWNYLGVAYHQSGQWSNAAAASLCCSIL